MEDKALNKKISLNKEFQIIWPQILEKIVVNGIKRQSKNISKKYKKY